MAANIPDQESLGSAISQRFVGPLPLDTLHLLQALAEGLEIPEHTEYIPNLVARYLTHAVQKRLHRGLLPGFRPVRKEMAKVRGRLDLRETVVRHLLDRGRVACRFEELRLDTPRHCHATAALKVLQHLVTDPFLAHLCQDLVQRLSHLGIQPRRATPQELIRDPVLRHDSDGLLILRYSQAAFGIAQLAKLSHPSPRPSDSSLQSSIARIWPMALVQHWRPLAMARGWKLTPAHQQFPVPPQAASIGGFARFPIRFNLTLNRGPLTWRVFTLFDRDGGSTAPLPQDIPSLLRSFPDQPAAMAGTTQPEQVKMLLLAPAGPAPCITSTPVDEPWRVEAVNLVAKPSQVLSHLNRLAQDLMMPEPSMSSEVAEAKWPSP